MGKFIIVCVVAIATSLVPTSNDGFYFYDSHEGETGAWMFCPAPLAANDCHVPTQI